MDRVEPRALYPSGFQPPVRKAPAPPPPAVEPDLAVRARLNAAIIDAILVGGIVAGVVATQETPAFSPWTLPLIVAAQFLYFFGLEARSGQTIGKRVMKIRVVALDGTPATLRMYAIRNVVRFADAFPLLYTSGLLSLVRTGRARRQRLGDVVAGTTVTVLPGARAVRTRSWMLPVTAAFAAALSVAAIFASVRPEAEDHAVLPAGLSLPGFTGDTSQEPRTGMWRVQGVVTSSNYTNLAEPVGTRFSRRWRIDRSCDTDPCSFVLTREIAHGGVLSARIIPAPDGWHATFPMGTERCTGPRGAAMPHRHGFWVLRFSDGGRTVDARERTVSQSPECGTATDTLVWRGRHS